MNGFGIIESSAKLALLPSPHFSMQGSLTLDRPSALQLELDLSNSPILASYDHRGVMQRVIFNISRCVILSVSVNWEKVL